MHSIKIKNIKKYIYIYIFIQITTYNYFFISQDGLDYRKTKKQISFTNGQGVGSNVTISIPIINDQIVENVESFFGAILLATVRERIYLVPNNTEVLIIDNDSKYMFQPRMWITGLFLFSKLCVN